MRKLLTAVIMISLTSIMIAKEIDIDKSKATDQERIVTLHPSPQSLEVAEDIMIKTTFDVALDAKHVKKNDITLEKLSEKKKKKIKGAVAYLADEKAVTFKPEVPLEVGYYEIKIKSLKPIKEEKEKKIKEITYRFYVPEVINGYMLPLEPDASVNNSTMLGIDANDNGVRDDVERKILKKYETRVKIEYMLLDAKIAQEILNNPIGNAVEMQKKNNRHSHCRAYLRKKKILSPAESLETIDFMENNTYNTKVRAKAYSDYNQALSGGVYGITRSKINSYACDFDVDGLLGGGQ